MDGGTNRRAVRGRGRKLHQTSFFAVTTTRFGNKRGHGLEHHNTKSSPKAASMPCAGHIGHTMASRSEALERGPLRPRNPSNRAQKTGNLWRKRAH
jgi:hypothetical protein